MLLPNSSQQPDLSRPKTAVPLPNGRASFEFTFPSGLPAGAAFYWHAAIVHATTPPRVQLTNVVADTGSGQ